MVDEAHATGVFGARGAGLVQDLNLTAQVEVQMGTLGRPWEDPVPMWPAPGVDRMAREQGSQFCLYNRRNPSAAATALAALEIVELEPERRARLWEMPGSAVAEGLKTLGYTPGEW